MERGLHAVAKGLVVLDNQWDKPFEGARGEKTNKASCEQTNNVVLIVTLLEDCTDTGLLAIFAKGGGISIGANIK